MAHCGDGLRFPVGTVCPLSILALAGVEFMFIGIVASGGDPLAAATRQDYW